MVRFESNNAFFFWCGKPHNVVSFGMVDYRIHMDKNHVTRRPEVSIGLRTSTVRGFNFCRHPIWIVGYWK